MGNIGIIGRARAGKDTAGKFFVDGHGYRRVALADPLKEAALRLDPIVDHKWEGSQLVPVRLARFVRNWGWERAKETSEVRRILQELGAAMRAVDEEVWLHAALKKVRDANDFGVPVVITDVRYRNEAASLVRAGFHLIHINRPGVPQLDHESERDLGPEDARYMVQNDGDLAHLGEQLERIWDEIYTIESLKHSARL
jgi:hypothetical protein